jgi:nucleotide-binding universal stress UspA family protein
MAADRSSWQRIVVGVDGSQTSRYALRWAANEAAAHDAELRVVHAWEMQPTGTAVGRTLTPGGAGGPERQRDDAERLLAEIVEGELSNHENLKVRTSIGRGSPAVVLLEAARDADMVVVGSRGAGGFAGLMLGSVSSKMASHATCPVVIVRPPAAQDEG